LALHEYVPYLLTYTLTHLFVVSDIAIFVLKRDVKLQLTNPLTCSPGTHTGACTNTVMLTNKLSRICITQQGASLLSMAQERMRSASDFPAPSISSHQCSDTVSWLTGMAASSRYKTAIIIHKRAVLGDVVQHEIPHEKG